MANYKTILTISDVDFDLTYQMGDISKYHTRRAARGLVFNNGKIAFINVTKLKFHKFPGGGIESGESIGDAFVREIIEEVGCKSRVNQKIGKVVEYRDRFQLKQINYILAAQVIGRVGTPTLQPDEIEEGFVLEWRLPIEILNILENDRPTDYEGKFIVKRDLHII